MTEIQRVEPAVAPTATQGRLAPLVADVPPDLAGLVGAWLLSLRSDPTRAAYARRLKTFWRWLATEAPGVHPLAVQRPAVDAWRAELEATRPASTAAVCIVAVRSFYAYATSVEAIGRNPAVDTEPTKVPNVGKTAGISVADVGRLLAAARESGPRDYALVLLLASTAVRISEAISLDAERITAQVDPGDGRTYRRTLVTRKGRRQEWVTIPDAAHAAIMAALGGRTTGPVFLTARGDRMTRQAAWRVVTRLARRAGIEHVHPHMFRVASITTALAQPGAQLHHVQDMAGHADPRTTRRYDREANSARLTPAHTLAPLFEAAERAAEKGKAS